MGRQDQWIGLTLNAAQYLVKLQESYNDMIQISDIELVSSSQSLSNYSFFGKKYVYTPINQKPNDTNSQYIIQEKIQRIFYSSGPMYFTCLQLLCIKKCGQLVELNSSMFEWIHVDNILIHHNYQEYDQTLGHIFM